MNMAVETINFNGLTDSEIDEIGYLVKGGFKFGISGRFSWKLETNEDESNRELIVELIREGHTSGCYPSWSLTFNRIESIGEKAKKLVETQENFVKMTKVQHAADIGEYSIYLYKGKFYLGIDSVLEREHENTSRFNTLKEAIERAEKLMLTGVSAY